MSSEFLSMSRLKYPFFYVRRSTSAFMSQFPILFIPMAKLLLVLQRQSSNISHILISKDTELVIEGYPRSGNSFAVVAFKMAQNRPIKMAHHLHLPINVELAVKRSMPCLVLIRDPDQAVLSLSVSFLKMDVRQALKEYVRFYEKISSLRESYVVASFGEVTQDFGTVIRKINRKFCTNYQEFQHTENNVEKCFHLIELDAMCVKRKNEVNKITVARPSRERKELKLKLETKLRVPALASLRNSAYCLYRKFLLYAKTI